MVEEVGEGFELEQVLAGGRLVDGLVLEDPGEAVGDEDGVESGPEGGIDVRAGAVADHPGGCGVAAMVRGEGEVGFVVFFGEDFDGAEARGEAGAVELAGLLGGVALGDEDEAVAGGELGEGLVDAREELDLVIGDGVGEVEDALVLLVGEGRVGELLEAVDEGAAEAAQAVAVGGDGGVLAVVEVLADLGRSVDLMIEVGDEGGDGALEVNVVLPQGVVGIDEQGMARRTALHRGGVCHVTIIEG